MLSGTLPRAHVFLEREASLSHGLHISAPHSMQTRADKSWLKTPDSPCEQSATRKSCGLKGCFLNLGPDDQRSAQKSPHLQGCTGTHARSPEEEMLRPKGRGCPLAVHVASAVLHVSLVSPAHLSPLPLLHCPPT